MYRSCLLPLLAGAVALVTSVTGSAAAADPATLCEAAKIGAAGKHVSTLLSCASKAAKDAAAVDPECTGKGDTKLSDSFAGADAKAGTPCNGLLLPTEDGGAELATGVGAIVEVPAGGGTCASLATKFAGKFAASLFKAYSADHKAPDPAKLTASIEKARATLQKGVTTAEGKGGCTTTGNYEDLRTLIEAAVAQRVACIVADEACEEVADEVGAGETVTTDPDNSGPDMTEPVTAAVETPNAGTVVIELAEATAAPPEGYEVLGQEVDITAPPASTTEPLVLTFAIDASLVPGDPSTVTVTRDGVVVGNCTGVPGVADPDPCVASRTVLGNGDLEIVVLTSHASKWVPVYALPSNGCPSSMLMDMLADDGVTDYATELDIGWTGMLHGLDRPGGTSFAMTLDCSSATAPACETCTITGFDPSYGNCRCANNTRVTCDQPFLADANDCGGSICQCYVGPPMHMIPNGSAVCLVERATAAPTGTWNVSAGSGSIGLSSRAIVYLGMSHQSPCPACVGDPTADDGVKGGTCSGGQFTGQSCDANGSDPTWPQPGGGFTSYDCMPSIGSNITGLGLIMTRTETTGHTQLDSNFACSGPNLGNCPCRVCSDNDSVACNSNADCSAVGAGTCSGSGTGVDTAQNSCSATCTVDADGEGVCDGDFDRYCDGLVDEDGNGAYTCSTNSDCMSISAGNCTIAAPRACFGPSITADGIADPVNPRTVSTLCVPPSSNVGANNITGLPGPARTRSDWVIGFAQ